LNPPPKSLPFVFFYFQFHFSKEKKIPLKRKGVALLPTIVTQFGSSFPLCKS
jgi:hypothetical protein